MTMVNWCHPVCMYVRMYIFAMCIRHLTLHTYVYIVRSLKFTRSNTKVTLNIYCDLHGKVKSPYADDKPYRVLLMADWQTTDCKLRTESRETLAECLGIRSCLSGATNH